MSKSKVTKTSQGSEESTPVRKGRTASSDRIIALIPDLPLESKVAILAAINTSIDEDAKKLQRQLDLIAGVKSDAEPAAE